MISMVQILLYLSIFAAGAILSKKHLIPRFIKKHLGNLQTISLLFLIFIMGYSIGVDDQIIAKVPVMGGKAVIFAAFTCGFSVLLTFLFYKIFSKNSKTNNDNN